MAVVINQFEAVGEAPQQQRSEAEASAPAKLEPAALTPVLRQIAARERRLKAY